jgi:hypothetical protein
MNFLKKASLFSVPFLLATGVAQAQPFQLGIEPIVGYEMVQKVLPTQHRTSRLTYGARVTAGILLISGELEYTRAQDTETFTAPARTTTDTTDKLKLGLRSSHSLGSLLLLTARGGVQAQQNKHEDSITGTSFTPVTYDPYAGAELGVRLTSKIRGFAGLVVVIHDINNMVANEYQTTAGFSISVP